MFNKNYEYFNFLISVAAKKSKFLLFGVVCKISYLFLFIASVFCECRFSVWLQEIARVCRIVFEISTFFSIQFWRHSQVSFFTPGVVVLHFVVSFRSAVSRTSLWKSGIFSLHHFKKTNNLFFNFMDGFS